MNRQEKFWFFLLEGSFFIAAIFSTQNMTFLDVALLGLAASFVGRAIAYLKVFEWVRAPFTVVVPHSSGVGETVEPKPGLQGIAHILSHLMSCPVCAGTWAALALSFLPTSLTYVLAASAIAWFVSYSTEAIEWTKHRNWAETGYIKKELD